MPPSHSRARSRRSRRPRRAFVIGVVLLALLATAAVAVATTGFGRSEHDRTAQNVILFIGDGMGDSEITSARNYEHGADGRFPGIDALPHDGRFTTHSLTKSGEPDYVADSAATATAWATGTKTYDGAIGVDVDDQPQTSLLELAKKKGLKTGNVTTSAIQDATPAAQMAHVPKRSCQDPEGTTERCPDSALENGGLGSITEQLLRTRPDVVLGGGADAFDEEVEAGEFQGATLLQQAEQSGFQVVEDRDALAAVERADQKAPLLGLFAEGHLPVSWDGPKATRTGGEEPAVRCEPNDDIPSSQPSLTQMTEKALSLLDGEKGFFLQVESASIDKSAHDADACGQIGEVVALDEAVQAARAFAKKDGNTTVLVTADHAQASQIVQSGANTRGLTTTLLTNEGTPMTLSYATGAKGVAQAHSGVQVPIFGEGPGAATVADLKEQTDLFGLISGVLGLDSGG